MSGLGSLCGARTEARYDGQKVPDYHMALCLELKAG
jgi:hypothetical protein